MTGFILGRYDAAGITDLFGEYGVFDATSRRGFSGERVEIDVSSGALSHIRLKATKDAREYLLLDACLAETMISPDFFETRGFDGYPGQALLVVYWCREQDPSVPFSTARPRLPLQEHPGLGILRRMFRIAKRMATDLGKSGLANMPKFYHDALIFYQSRLFLFLDSEEQGRFEALARDLSDLSLQDATLAVIGGCVFDGEGHQFRWAPGFQAYPVSGPLSEYFNSAAYAEGVKQAVDAASFSFDAQALQTARAVYAARLGQSLV